MMRTGPKASYAAPAVEKAFEVLELLTNHPGGALISEMAVLMNRSIGEIFRIVIVMEKLGYLHKSPRDDRYSVSYKLLDLAFRATPAQDLVAAATSAMRKLVIDAEQSCHLVVINEGAGLVIAREQNPGTRGFSLRLGAEVDLLTSCSGAVLLAFSPDDLRDSLVKQATALSGCVIDQEELEKRFISIQKRGHEQRKSFITRGVTDLSYPIFGFDRKVVAALTIPFLELINGSQRVDIGVAKQYLRDAAADISNMLGYSDVS
ncbi:IclR family transcriptional regulator [Sphingobium sp. BYY-5]|uniref:IclR family transcriptional regulator n=1 Tax=Sphingobium sp. BYY-5 TaxID=2926400 RepID=UPI001FA7941B|nr:IclR family transcriptional regulator [Sphingobium sp. BYY-5]MCI4589495.1 IclR family transcriptional regulator [Sphingobium sp. BYY-5]